MNYEIDLIPWWQRLDIGIWEVVDEVLNRPEGEVEEDD